MKLHYIFFFAPQRNIFHRCFELHLLHLDDERDLHRAAPRDVTLENLTTAGYICSPSHGVDRADQIVSLIVEDLEHPRVGEDPNNADSGV